MKKWMTVMIVMCSLMLCCACNNGIEADNSQEGVEHNDIVMYHITTPYCDLTLPANFEQEVITEVLSEEPYILVFKVREDNTELFKLLFGTETDNLIGTLPLEKENIVIYAEFAPLDSEAEQYEQYGTYQQAINTIIEGLVAEYEFIINDVVEYVDSATFDVTTEYVTLAYPVKWKSEVTIEQKEKSVSFYKDDILLFDIIFEECDGYLLGTYKDTPIYVISYSFDEKNLSQEEYKKLGDMQEGINTIIDHLNQDENFVMNH